MNASDLMSKPVTTILPDATVQQAAQLMLLHNLSCLPVVDQQGHLLGIMSHSDFGLSSRFFPMADSLYTLMGSSASPKHLEEISREVASKQVKDVMSHPVVTVQEDAPVAQVAETMMRDRIHHLPVMRGHQLVGIITSHDFLKLVASGEESASTKGS